MLHYLLGLTSYSSCVCWRATCVVRDSLYQRRKVGSSPNPAEARHCSPVHVHTYIRGCPTLLPFTSLRASPHSPRPDPTPAKGEVCEFHKQQQHQLSDNNRTYPPEPTPFPYSIPLVSRKQCQEEVPGWEAQGDVADADRSHAPLEDECRLVLPYRLSGDFHGDDVQGERARAIATVLCQGPQRECANNLYQK